MPAFIPAPIWAKPGRHWYESVSDNLFERTTARSMRVRLVRILIPAAILSVTLTALAAALLYSGSTSDPLAESDPAVAWALPAAKLMFNLSAAAIIGALVLACTALNPESPDYAKALNLAAVSAAVWAVVSAASTLLAYLDAANEPPVLDDAFGARFGVFVTSVGLGQIWLTTTLIAAVVTILCVAVRNIAFVGVVTGVAIGGLIPLTLNGYPNYGEGHDAATELVEVARDAGMWRENRDRAGLPRPPEQRGPPGVGRSKRPRPAWPRWCGPGPASWRAPSDAAPGSAQYRRLLPERWRERRCVLPAVPELWRL